MADYKYFPQEVVERILDTSTPADVAVRMVQEHITKVVDTLTQSQNAEMMLEAQRLGQAIHRANDRDRQNKMHNLYLDIKVKDVREEFMLIMTTCNNAAFIVIGDALDKVRQLPEYQGRFSQMRRAFNHAEQEREAYKRALRHSTYRWLDPRDFTDEQKKRFAPDLTIEEYSDYWECIGGKAYLKVLDEVNVLRNKFRLSVEAHGLPHAEASAAVLAGASMLILCEAVFSKSVKRLCVGYSLSKQDAFDRMKDFSLKRMMLAWGKCVRQMGPVTKLDDQESRNIEMTLEQLVAHWNDTTFFYSSIIEAAEDFPEVFRTKGEQKKYIRMLSEKAAQK